MAIRTYYSTTHAPSMYVANEYYGPSALLGRTRTWMEELVCYHPPHAVHPQVDVRDEDLTSTGSSTLSESAGDLNWLDDLVAAVSEQTNVPPSTSIAASTGLQLQTCGITASGAAAGLLSNVSSPSSSFNDGTMHLSCPGSPAQSTNGACPSEMVERQPQEARALPKGVLKDLLAQNRVNGSPGPGPFVSDRSEYWQTVPSMSTAASTTITTMMTTALNRLSHFSGPVPSSPEATSPASPPEAQWRLSETVCKKHKRLRQTRRRPERSLITGKRKFRCETCTSILERHVREHGSKLRPKDREELLKLVGMSLQQLEFWFSNRRRAEKQQGVVRR